MEPAEQNVVKGIVRCIATGISGSMELSFVSLSRERLKRLDWIFSGDGVVIRREEWWGTPPVELVTMYFFSSINLFESWIKFRLKKHHVTLALSSNRLVRVWRLRDWRSLALVQKLCRLRACFAVLLFEGLSREEEVMKRLGRCEGTSGVWPFGGCPSESIGGCFMKLSSE